MDIICYMGVKINRQIIAWFVTLPLPGGHLSQVISKSFDVSLSHRVYKNIKAGSILYYLGNDFFDKVFFTTSFLRVMNICGKS